jgi:hypothetical protein
MKVHGRRSRCETKLCMFRFIPCSQRMVFALRLGITRSPDPRRLPSRCEARGIALKVYSNIGVVSQIVCSRDLLLAGIYEVVIGSVITGSRCLDELPHIADTGCCGVRRLGDPKTLRIRRKCCGTEDGNGQEVARVGKCLGRRKQRWLVGRRGMSRGGNKLWALNHDGRDDRPFSSRPWQGSCHTAGSCTILEENSVMHSRVYVHCYIRGTICRLVSSCAGLYKGCGY